MNGKPVESVWDFPRPPRLERVDWRVRVIHGGVTIVDAPQALRVLETSQAPAYYVAAEWVDLDRLHPSPRRSLCEWKGVAEYADVLIRDVAVAEAAWTYPSPSRAFAPLANHWAFYAQKVDECRIDDERSPPTREASTAGGSRPT